ncbi:MAG: hypothetical protein D6795_17845 [Deltaproteobacteria bacterium]|nr:MAG: hypothetical protein D6795_17845 [Deltaproteobacteria bacterium]
MNGMRNPLMEQVFDDEQIAGRRRRIRINRAARKIAYKAPNGMIFFIDTRPVEEGGEPEIWTDQGDLYTPRVKKHIVGRQRVCLAASLRGWELSRILFQCDSWARAQEIFLETGYFPMSPREAFSPRTVSRARALAQGNGTDEIRGWFEH